VQTVTFTCNDKLVLHIFSSAESVGTYSYHAILALLQLLCEHELGRQVNMRQLNLEEGSIEKLFLQMQPRQLNLETLSLSFNEAFYILAVPWLVHPCL
jgi:hypothetical protein